LRGARAMAGEDIHESVLLVEAVDALIRDVDGIYVDCTYGRGGHSRRILSKLSERGKLLVLDKDPQAIAHARTQIGEDKRVLIAAGSFADVQNLVESQGISGKVDGMLFDLGVSSPQLDDRERGFSFLRDGPLDMRMDNSAGITAAQWINEAREEEIANVIWKYGEERFSRRMAKAVVFERQRNSIKTTLQLADVFKAAHPNWEKHKHPATRAFQAIRIFINEELEDLEIALKQVPLLLKESGRFVAISFHSLEDRIVKRFIRLEERGAEVPREIPLLHSQLERRLRAVGKPIREQEQQVDSNPRARSAIMRVAERVAY